MGYRVFILILILLSPVFLFAQQTDITGLWKGTLYNDTNQLTYQYEIGISREKGKYSGFSHTWFTLGDSQYFGVKKVSVKIAGDGKIIVEDKELISNNYPIKPSKGVRQLNILTLNTQDSIMTLQGPFSTNKTKEYTSLTGFINLTRKNDFWHSSLVPHLEELQKAGELSFVKEARQKEIKNQEDEQTRLAAKQEKEKAEWAMAEKQKEAALKKQLQQQKEIAQSEEMKKNNELKKQELLAKAEEKKIKEEQKIQAQKEKEITRNNLKNEKEIARAASEVQEIKKTEKANEKKEEPGLVRNINPAADVSVRKTVVQQTVYFSGDSLYLALYDNGEIDGDTVSVLMNGNIILARQGLSASAIKKTIYIAPGTREVELVMYAETLGSIPPNTGLLIVRDGKSVYELRFSGDYKQNASILFKRKTPE